MKRQARKIWMDSLVLALVFVLTVSGIFAYGTDNLPRMGENAVVLAAGFAMPEGALYMLQNEMDEACQSDTEDMPEAEAQKDEGEPDEELNTPPPPDPQDVAQAMALIPEPDRGIIETAQFVSASGGDDYFVFENGCIRNATSYSNDEMLSAASKPMDWSIELNSAEPQVLVIHTHSTESYDRFDVGFYDVNYPTRQTDITQNINVVGQQICDSLNAMGIRTIHATEYHDYPSYNNAYSRSAETTKKYLEMYPSIKIVLDIHRDGIQREDGTRVKPTVMVNNRKAAQIMIISGADDGTMNMPDFRKNLQFAVRLQDSVATLYPGLARPVYLAYRHYNQDLTTGSLLIEVGSESNTLEEAQYTGELIANALGHLFGASVKT